MERIVRDYEMAAPARDPAFPLSHFPRKVPVPQFSLTVNGTPRTVDVSAVTPSYGCSATRSASAAPSTAAASANAPPALCTSTDSRQEPAAPPSVRQ